jgi:hypothetical protein
MSLHGDGAPPVLGLRLYYSVFWLARVARMDVRRMHRLLRSRGVTPQRWNRNYKVALSQLRSRMPELWRALLSAEVERTIDGGERSSFDRDRRTRDGDQRRIDRGRNPDDGAKRPGDGRSPSAGREPPTVDGGATRAGGEKSSNGGDESACDREAPSSGGEEASHDR